jgi:REP element-mobilizing transposase RayT
MGWLPLGARHRSGKLIWVSATWQNPSVEIRWAEPRPQGAVEAESTAIMIYLITFACYGCHLHGHESGSVDREHNLPGSRLVEADAKRVSAERQRMDQPPYSMDRSCREAVLGALLERCSQRHWNLLAAHVRTNHVHVVVEAEARPERIMNDLKAYASRCLNRLGLDPPGRKRWARHGSTRWLWKPQSVSAAIRYIVDEQGDPMAVFEAIEP